MLPPDNKNFNWIWKMNCPNKIKFFIWLCQHERTPTSNYLQGLGMDVKPNYMVCGSIESIKHIFLECPLATKYWEQLDMIDDIQSIIDSNNHLWLIAIKKAKNYKFNKKLDWGMAFPFFIWNIWLKRNHNYHNKKI